MTFKATCSCRRKSSIWPVHKKSGLADSSIGSALAYIAAHVDAFLSIKQRVFVTIRLQFYDGSSIKVLVKLGETTIYVLDSARDSTGHALLDYSDANRYPGRWNFGPGAGSDMAAFIEYMRSLGVTIITGSLPNGR